MLLLMGFSPVEENGGCSLAAVHWPLIAVTSPVACRAWVPGARASAVVAHGLSCSEACGDLPGSGIKPMCPALAGGFLTSGPPGKFSLTFFIFFKPVITVGNLNSFLLENCTISFSTISSQGQGNWGICLPTHFLQLIEGCRGVF